ncbi:MAG TPA: PaaX family transcriptional regulator C-terminal domain-containing protein [Kineosporiaceae bacterium]|nr:PaaX family transcriptional regulator C-terminal domain-containing protein [Kineosporiaceae bacterium]
MVARWDPTSPSTGAVTPAMSSAGRSSGPRPAASAAHSAGMDAGIEVDLPRTQAGSPPQHLLVTVLADYCLRRSARMPSAALVTLAGDFGVTAMSARAALSRLARRGVVEQTRSGRRTFYALSPDAARVLLRGSRRLVAFAGDAEGWDGHWTVVAFSMPEDRRDARHLLRSRLRWQGFAPLYDGMWVSPQADSAEAVETVEALDVPAVTVLRAVEVLPAGSGFRPPLHAWDLDEIAAGYEEFLDRWSPVVDRLRRGDVTAGEALVVRTRIMDTYRRFPGLDPQLPMRLMPQGWPRARALALFTEAYDWLGPLAETRVRQLIAEHDPGLAALASHQTTADLLSGVAVR